MTFMSQTGRRPLVVLSLLTVLTGLLVTSCSSSDSEMATVKAEADSAAVSDGISKQKDNSNNASNNAYTPELAAKEVPVVSAAEAGEDAFEVEDHSGAAATPVNIEVGMPYAEARSRIMQQGWVPDPQPAPEYGVENAFHERGFTEVESCAGTGLGPCIFYFIHPERTAPNQENVLRVNTTGGASHPNISGWDTYHFSETLSAPSSDTTLTEIPVRFRGEWNPDLDSCYAEYSDGRLSIEPDYVRFYDSAGPVIRVIKQGTDQVLVTTELASEGTTYESEHTFTLSNNDTALSTDMSLVRYRCP
ncbi:MAG: hypothetical protein AAF716_17185 [Cyanobacteria bacterium P01_D01_bin.1]